MSSFCGNFPVLILGGLKCEVAVKGGKSQYPMSRFVFNRRSLSSWMQVVVASLISRCVDSCG